MLKTNVRQTSGSSDQGQIEKIAFAPLALGGAGRGAQLLPREKQITYLCGQPARDFFGIGLVAAPLP